MCMTNCYCLIYNKPFVMSWLRAHLCRSHLTFYCETLKFSFIVINAISFGKKRKEEGEKMHLAEEKQNGSLMSLEGHHDI